jgi:large subunit ribosomal protein L21
MAYAVIKTGGKQYRVAPGDVIEIEKLPLEAGASTTFTDVLLVAAEGAALRVGSETIGATVSAEIVDQFKGPKVIAYKYRRRKGYHRTVGHRQKLTRVKITGING